MTSTYGKIVSLRIIERVCVVVECGVCGLLLLKLERSIMSRIVYDLISQLKFFLNYKEE